MPSIKIIQTTGLMKLYRKKKSKKTVAGLVAKLTKKTRSKSCLVVLGNNKAEPHSKSSVWIKDGIILRVISNKTIVLFKNKYLSPPG